MKSKVNFSKKFLDFSKCEKNKNISRNFREFQNYQNMSKYLIRPLNNNPHSKLNEDNMAKKQKSDEDDEPTLDLCAAGN